MTSQSRRIVRQKLESLQRSGVRQLGRPSSRAAADGPPEQAKDRPPDQAEDRPDDAAAKPQTLPNLAQKVANCRLCGELAESRKQTVFGVGDPNARLCFLGEAPGADEDRLGEPFVGRAGRLLNDILKACQLQRDDVYILNVLKCRPPQNRTPLPQEIDHCRPFFVAQLELIQPEYICCLGGVAATSLLETKSTLGRLRGTFHRWRESKVLVTYHPAYLLRNPTKKRDTWNDMQMLMKDMGVELSS